MIRHHLRRNDAGLAVGASRVGFGCATGWLRVIWERRSGPRSRMWHGSSLRLRQRLAHLCLLPGLFEAFVDFVPVDDVPPCGEIFRTAVLVFQVIGVLPDIVAEDGVVSLRERGILVGGGDDLQLAAVPNEPAPSGAELLCRGFVELLLKGLEIAEVLLDLLADFAGGFTSALHFIICQNMVW